MKLQSFKNKVLIFQLNYFKDKHNIQRINLLWNSLTLFLKYNEWIV